MIQPARVVLLAALALAGGCGKKGPPLAPLHLVPGPATDVSIRRLGPDAQIQFLIPATNLNGPGRAEIDRVEVYAVTVAPGSPPPPNRELLNAKYLVGSVPVKPPPVEGETPPENAPPDPRPGPGEPAKFVEPLTAEKLKPVTFAAPAPPKGAAPAPRPATTPAGAGATGAASPPAAAGSTPAGSPAPGAAATPPATPSAAGTVTTPAAPAAPAAAGITPAEPSGAAGTAPGAPAVAGAASTTPAASATAAGTTPPTGAERVTAAGTTAATPAAQPATTAATTAAQPAAPAGPKYAVRIYVLRGMTKRGRSGQPSARVQLPVVPPPAPPSGVTPTVAENAIVLKWTAPPPAEPLPDVAAAPAVTTAPPAVPGTTAPAAPANPAAPAAGTTAPVAPVNPAASAAGTAVPGTTTAAVTAAPAALSAPPALSFNVYKPDTVSPINSEPIAAPQYERPGVTFGSEECFVVRTVEKIGSIAIESEPSPPACVTPRDTFAPAQPKGLAIVAGTGTINLSWDANTEADLAGYLVLRGEAAGGTLQPLTPSPIAGISFEDKTVRPGVRYAYAIVAVDKATPANSSAPSARVEETAR